MMTQISKKCIDGKTIRKILFDSELTSQMIIFTDSTYIVFWIESDGEYEMDRIKERLSFSALDNSFDKQELIDYGVITSEEWNTYYDIRYNPEKFFNGNIKN